MERESKLFRCALDTRVIVEGRARGQRVTKRRNTLVGHNVRRTRDRIANSQKHIMVQRANVIGVAVRHCDRCAFELMRQSLVDLHTAIKHQLVAGHYQSGSATGN